MPVLKKDGKYVYIYNKYFDDYTAQIYVCDHELKFKKNIKDWNCDGEVYPIEGIYMTKEYKCTVDFISKEEFMHSCYDYKPIKENIYFARDMQLYKLLMEIKHDGMYFLLVERYGDKYIYKKQDLKEIKFV